jgi:dTDP-4-amino-4,6-dideoxygalactose transaminase
MNPIAFIDLAAQQKTIQPQLENAFKRVLEHGQYILGPEVYELEQRLSDYTGASHTISCANGTDALSLLLMAKGVSPNDAIFVPSFTYAATAEVIAHAGAVPFFVDVVEDTFNISVQSLEAAINLAKKNNLKPKGIIAVDLFGLPSDYETLSKIAQQHGLWLISDAAQSFGAKIKEKRVGALCEMSTTSFFPSKPLACYGDGGAIFLNTEDESFVSTLRSLRAHGIGRDRYDFVHIGINSRLDTLQAAILLEKLNIFDEEHKKRLEIARFYEDHLNKVVHTPRMPSDYTHALALYTIRCESKQRTPLLELLKKEHIPYMIYYQTPLHLQAAYQHFPKTSLEVTNQLSQEVISIPMHPYLTEEQLHFIVDTVQRGLK